MNSDFGHLRLGISEFSKKAASLLTTLRHTSDGDDSRAARFRQALIEAENNINVDLTSITNVPSWMDRDHTQQKRLMYIAGSLTHASSLARSLDALLLRRLADEMSETTLDHIIAVGEADVGSSPTSPSLDAIMRDGASVLLATLPARLRTHLMDKALFVSASNASIAQFEPMAEELVNKASAL